MERLSGRNCSTRWAGWGSSDQALDQSFGPSGYQGRALRESVDFFLALCEDLGPERGQDYEPMTREALAADVPAVPKTAD